MSQKKRQFVVSKGRTKDYERKASLMLPTSNLKNIAKILEQQLEQTTYIVEEREILLFAGCGTKTPSPECCDCPSSEPSSGGTTCTLKK